MTLPSAVAQRRFCGLLAADAEGSAESLRGSAHGVFRRAGRHFLSHLRPCETRAASADGIAAGECKARRLHVSARVQPALTPCPADLPIGYAATPLTYRMVTGKRSPV